MKTLLNFRTLVVVAFVGWCIAVTPAYVYPIQLGMAAIGLFAFFAVQVRTTKDSGTYALARTALWALAAVGLCPLLPLLHITSDVLWGVGR